MRRCAAIIAVWGLGALAHRILWLSGRDLDRPEGASLGELEAWYRTVEPADATAAVAWLAGVAVGGWLVVALVLQVVAAIPGGACIRPVADLISPRSLQRLGRGLAGLSLTAGLAAVAPSAGLHAPSRSGPPPVTAPAAPAEADAAGTATMSRLDGPATSTVPTVVPPSTSAAPATPTSVDPAPAEPGRSGDAHPPVTTPPGPSPIQDVPHSPAPTAAQGDGGLAPAPPAVAVRDKPPARAAGETVVVEPGMSFWSIAAKALVDAGHPSDEASVGRYWRRVIEANRDRLVVPANPDLLLPGQELVLPPR